MFDSAHGCRGVPVIEPPPRWWGRRDATRENLPRATAVLGLFFTAELAIHIAAHFGETFLLGRLGPEYLSAATLGNIIIALAFGLPIELGTGLTTVVAQYAGARNEAGVAEAIGQVILLCALLSLPFFGIGLWLAPQLLALVGADSTVLAVGVSYLRLGLLAMFFLVLPFPLSAALRALGHAALATGTQVLQMVVVLFLLPFLVFGIGFVPRLEATGAMAALIITRAIMLVFVLTFLCSRRSGVQLNLGSLRPNLPLMRRLLALSLAPAGQQYTRFGADVLIVRLIAVYGTVAVAAYGITLRVLEALETVALGLGNAAFTVVAQNLGARQPERALRGTWIAVAYSLGVIGVGVVAIVLAAPVLVGFFNSRPDVVAFGAPAVRIIVMSFAANAITLVLARAFHGAGDTVSPFAVDLVAQWAIQLPLAYLLSRMGRWNIEGVWLAIAIANLSRTLALGLWFRRRASGQFSRAANLIP